ncbi:hypothetical protein GCM10020229_00590 [Kitasatospora albolonga]|uniref:DUF2637 domain-containing protein n=1 Tax=Kitasatospora albolonga TaxID=68173 RepID=UPI0031EC03B4
MTAWDRLAVALIGVAGFALSFDALQQMAVAIHVRGPLAYVFPLTVDGFIAYGVRALLVLRAAPWPARLYAWFLFAGATAASVWANALHAVRLNQVLDQGDGLQLGDGVVAALSMLSPLALGGAVHLYILIARHAITPQPAPAGASGGTSADSALSDPGAPDQLADGPCCTPWPSAATGLSVSGGPEGPDETAVRSAPSSSSTPDEAGGPLSSAADSVLVRADGGPGAGSAELSGSEARTDGGGPDADGVAEPSPDAGGGPGRRTGRPAGVSMERLLEVSRPAVRAHGRPSRPVVERAVREANLPMGSTRFTVLMDELRKEFPHGPAREHPPVD